MTLLCLIDLQFNLRQGCQVQKVKKINDNLASTNFQEELQTYTWLFTSCVTSHSVMNFGSAYLGYCKQRKFFQNVLQCDN